MALFFLSDLSHCVDIGITLNQKFYHMAMPLLSGNINGRNASILQYHVAEIQSVLSDSRRKSRTMSRSIREFCEAISVLKKITYLPTPKALATNNLARCINVRTTRNQPHDNDCVPN